LAREEMKTQYKKAEKQIKAKPQTQISFLCLNLQKENSFQRLLSSTPWNKLADIYI